MKAPEPRGRPCRSHLEYARERIPDNQRKANVGSARYSYCIMHETVEVSSTVVTIWLGMLILAAVSGIASFHEVVWSPMCVASQVCVNMYELEQRKLGKN